MSRGSPSARHRCRGPHRLHRGGPARGHGGFRRGARWGAGHTRVRPPRPSASRGPGRRRGARRWLGVRAGRRGRSDAGPRRAGSGLPDRRGRVPIVVGMCLFDLLEGDASVRPGAADGAAALDHALDPSPPGRTGPPAVGSGVGALTVLIARAHRRRHGRHGGEMAWSAACPPRRSRARRSVVVSSSSRSSSRSTPSATSSPAPAASRCRSTRSPSTRCPGAVRPGGSRRRRRRRGGRPRERAHHARRRRDERGARQGRVPPRGPGCARRLRPCAVPAAPRVDGDAVVAAATGEVAADVDLGAAYRAERSTAAIRIVGT